MKRDKVVAESKAAAQKMSRRDPSKTKFPPKH
jgi:hypothetical protein